MNAQQDKCASFPDAFWLRREGRLGFRAKKKAFAEALTVALDAFAEALTLALCRSEPQKQRSRVSDMVK